MVRHLISTSICSKWRASVTRDFLMTLMATCGRDTRTMSLQRIHATGRTHLLPGFRMVSSANSAKRSSAKVLPKLVLANSAVHTTRERRRSCPRCGMLASTHRVSDSLRSCGKRQSHERALARREPWATSLVADAPVFDPSEECSGTWQHGDASTAAVSTPAVGVPTASCTRLEIV